MTRYYSGSELNYEKGCGSLQRNLIDTLMYYSRTPDRFMFPINGDFVSLLLINSVMKYTGDRKKNFLKNKLKSKWDRIDKESGLGWRLDMYEKVHDLFKTELELKDCLDKEVKRGLISLITPRKTDHWDTTNIGFNFSELYHRFDSGRFQSNNFCLNEHDLYFIKKYSLPEWTQPQLESIGGISKLLRDNIDKEFSEGIINRVS